MNEKWAHEGLASKEWKPAPQCQWASRPHNVQKTKRGSAKSDPDFGVRNVGDYVYVNSQCKRMQANQPNNVQFYLERVAGRRVYWYTDRYNQFKGWQLKEKSRDLAAV